MTQTQAAAQYHRCGQCGYVVGPQIERPGGCPNCQTPGGAFAGTDIVFPERPTAEALARDTRAVEAKIRAAYARLVLDPGDSVALAALRDALPADLDRDTVDAALVKLAAHSGVQVTPRRDQKQADARTQKAALAIGAGYSHALSIAAGPSLADTLQRIRSTSQVQAESMLAPLSDRDVAYLAERMNVAADGTRADLRRAVADCAEHNHQQWLADADQGAQDGKLLYRADTDPDWVAGWTDDDRQRAAEAAARLQHRAATEPRWAYVRERADQWAAPQGAPGRPGNQNLAAEVVTPVPAAAAVPTPRKPTSLPRSSEEIRPPNGGHGVDQGLMHFDGALGKLWNALGDDQHLQIDGRALGNVVTDLGEGITLHKHDTSHALSELRRIRTQLPDASTAARNVDVAINRLNAPDRPAPNLPDNAPQQLQDLMADLNAIPLVRRGYDVGGGEPFHETDYLAEVTGRWLRGEINRSAFEREILGLTHRRHESSEGWIEIRAAVSRAMNDFREWAKRPT